MRSRSGGDILLSPGELENGTRLTKWYRSRLAPSCVICCKTRVVLRHATVEQAERRASPNVGGCCWRRSPDVRRLGRRYAADADRCLIWPGLRRNGRPSRPRLQSQPSGKQETIVVFLMPSQRRFFPPCSQPLLSQTKMVSNDADEEATRNPRNNHTKKRNKAYDYSRAAPREQSARLLNGEPSLPAACSSPRQEETAGWLVHHQPFLRYRLLLGTKLGRLAR